MSSIPPLLRRRLRAEAAELRCAYCRRRRRVNSLSGVVIINVEHSMSDQNKAAARVAFEVWSTGDLDGLDEYIASDVVHHDPYDPHGADGLAGMKKSIKRNRSVYPDLHMTIEDQLAEGSKVATRWSATMTHEGKRVTLPATLTLGCAVLKGEQKSLSLPSVQKAIARGKPLIASFGDPPVTEPVGGHGLVRTNTR